MNRDKRVLGTGGRGFIGVNLARVISPSRPIASVLSAALCAALESGRTGLGARQT